MKIVLINRVYGMGSTGKIVIQIANAAINQGYKCYFAHRYKEKEWLYDKNVISVSSWLDCHIHNRLSRLTMLQGCFSKIKTLIFLNKIKRINPEIIHLHNIHGSFINHAMLFEYLKTSDKKVIWTLHDCWPFTGHCRHFEMIKCDKWQVECNKCIDKREAIIDSSRMMYKRKKKLFTNVPNMEIVTPSQWLADLVKQSFLREYPVRIINNGIDLEIFKITESDFREKYNLQEKKIVLGVAFEWNKRKGLDVFVELSKRLKENYRIVLVGTNEQIDLILPPNIISIHKTASQKELAEIYTVADVFVNPTREDNYPTVNMEAIACGTPVITFDTGGSAEMIDDTCGKIVDCDDINSLIREIIQVTAKDYTRNCLRKAKEFDMKNCFEAYSNMYRELEEEIEDH